MKNPYKNRTIILHDTFLYKGGGERLVMYMREVLNCDLAAGFFDPGSYSHEEIKATAPGMQMKELMKSRVFKKGFRHIKLKLTFLFRTKFLKGYNTVILSGDCISAVRNCRKNTRKIFYCHTPPRYIFDKRNWYRKQLKRHYPLIWIFVIPVYNFVLKIFEKQYINDIRKMDLVLVNSKFVQERVKKYTGVDAQILYPPVNLQKFERFASGYSDSISETGYYLSFSRLAKLKRVDEIVKAFLHMPEKKLIVTYGENDPEKDVIFKIANEAPNIEFRSKVSDEELIYLISGATATVYVPKDEDFGMSPIESMACGTPVIGVSEGGILETVVHGKTGILLSGDFAKIDLMNAVHEMDIAHAQTLRDDCRKQAEKFGFEVFQNILKDIIDQ